MKHTHHIDFDCEACNQEYANELALEQGAQAGAIQAANQVSASPVNGSGQ